jgi:hypothetical protein
MRGWGLVRDEGLMKELMKDKNNHGPEGAWVLQSFQALPFNQLPRLFHAGARELHIALLNTQLLYFARLFISCKYRTSTSENRDTIIMVNLWAKKEYVVGCITQYCAGHACALHQESWVKESTRYINNRLR